MAAVRRYGPPLALMGLIWFLSAQPDLSTGLGGWDLVLRKIGHMAVFGTLFLLWWRALPEQGPVIAAVITVAYAVTDELHQTTVTGRHGTALDVLIDATGVLVAWLTWRRLRTQRSG